ncbi:hypothetical protein COLO4_25734 [Corchorus olitorius]|uniref:Cysteine alpha-hairpin motif superfamily n=1 Tax=Corchorus olitorius TaxID=93759 RepID=A0A1R3I0B1_9ROSI|nr:hypothetical protein COLO4_25734 [Corchorus olitorius]
MKNGRVKPTRHNYPHTENEQSGATAKISASASTTGDGAPPKRRQEDENVKQLGDCSTVYLSLQDCLINSNRDWKSCQKEVQALKACNERRNDSKKK